MVNDKVNRSQVKIHSHNLLMLSLMCRHHIIPEARLIQIGRVHQKLLDLVTDSNVLSLAPLLTSTVVKVGSAAARVQRRPV